MPEAGSRIAVTGAGGQLGSDLVERLQGAGFVVDGYSRSELDVTDAEAVDSKIRSGAYDVVVNSSALTNVDLCEEQGELATAVNATGAYLLARACASAGSRYLYIGTDFVFSGEKTSPYLEEDQPEPVNIYGASKRYGEMLSSLAHPETLIVRISSVFGKAGSRGKGGNFVEAILAKARSGESLRVIDDITMSPTYTAHVADIVPDLLRARASGVIHLANSGSCTWFEFARAALELCGLGDSEIQPVTAEEFPRPARRPSNSALGSGRLERLTGRRMPHWQEALRDYLAEKGHLAAGVGREETNGQPGPKAGIQQGQSEDRR